MTTARQIDANRLNAQKSTGPRTEAGKAVARLNAVRHGVLSSVAVAIGEDQPLFDAWLRQLEEELRPATPLESALVEKIAVALWRSRRLLEAEAAAMAFKRQPAKIAEAVSLQVAGFNRAAVSADDLEQYPEEARAWHEAILTEMQTVDGVELTRLSKRAPAIYAALKAEAGEENLSVEAYIAQCYDGDLAAYLAELRRFSEGEVRKAAERPRLLQLALHALNRTAVPSLADAQLVARYQTMLDNQLFKTIAALREAQERRIEAMEVEPEAASND